MLQLAPGFGSSTGQSGLFPDRWVWQRQVTVVPQLVPSPPPFHGQAVQAHGAPPMSQNERSVEQGWPWAEATEAGQVVATVMGTQ
jgi:hypothetical protein